MNNDRISHLAACLVRGKEAENFIRKHEYYKKRVSESLLRLFNKRHNRLIRDWTVKKQWKNEQE